MKLVLVMISCSNYNYTLNMMDFLNFVQARNKVNNLASKIYKCRTSLIYIYFLFFFGYSYDRLFKKKMVTVYKMFQ